MNDKDNTENQFTPLSMESVVEDLFGLNLRGLRSIAKLWVRPRDYFTAAKAVNWNDTFTPSIRLWLFFFALFSAFKFLWVGNGEGMIEAFANGFTDARIQVLGRADNCSAQTALLLRCNCAKRQSYACFHDCYDVHTKSKPNGLRFWPSSHYINH